MYCHCDACGYTGSTHDIPTSLAWLHVLMLEFTYGQYDRPLTVYDQQRTLLM
jgi:hypothetical protein